MGFFEDLMGVIGGVGSLISGISTAQTNQQNIAINKENLQLQKDVFNYQQNLQNTIFQREDTAIQRQMADYKAAGLNPLMAAGGAGAGAGAVVGVDTPQQAPNPDTGPAILAMTNALMSVTRVRAENELTGKRTEATDAQIENLKKDIELKDKELGIKDEEIKSKQIENYGKSLANRRLEKDLKIEEASNSHSQSGLAMKEIRDVIGVVYKVGEDFVDGGQYLMKKWKEWGKNNPHGFILWSREWKKQREKYKDLTKQRIDARK